MPRFDWDVRRARLIKWCVRTSKAPWNTVLRDAFIRVFPFLLLMNGFLLLSNYLAITSYADWVPALQQASKMISASLPIVFTFYLASSIATVYALERAGLTFYALIGVLMLSVRQGETKVLSLGACLVVVVFISVGFALIQRVMDRRSNLFVVAILQALISFVMTWALVLLVIKPLFAVSKAYFGTLVVSIVDGHQSIELVYMLAVMARGLLSFMGFHGHNMLYELFEGIYALSPTYRSVDVAFAGIGGTGATLCFFAGYAVLWYRKRYLNSSVVKAAPFALFNVNEILVYGYPLAWNPFFFVPFLLAPVVMAGAGLMAFHFGLLDMPDQIGHWMLPSAMQVFRISSQGNVLFMLWLAAFLCASSLYWWFLTIHYRVESSQRGQMAAAEFRVTENIDIRGAESAHALDRSVRYQEAQIYAAKWFQPDRLKLVYQPLISREGQMVGVEALLRTYDGQKLGTPAELLEAVDVLGLHEELDRLVLANCQTALQEYVNCFRDVNVAVNISPQFAATKDFTEFVIELQRELPLPITLELTEGSAAEDIERLCADFAHLRETRGIRIAIDDFGSGYSSLSYLQNIRVDKLKLDRSLMPAIRNPVSIEVVRALVELAHALDFEVVFEGVETAEQLQLLSDLGVDTFQGFFLGRPMLAEDLVVYALKLGEQDWQQYMSR
ncbi:MAG: PTS sugar transporter subunit IIC/EAL domain-containing protein [Gammaproteobacteria bacterium]|nr:PTS sugar transporter subunit IIC/EAL domain-containing protein [Gammaproteobacteria bacterium]